MTPHPIPDAALESDIAILGKKGRGKSYTARGLVERLLDAGRQVVVLDPLSTWWGLKAGPHGYPIPVIGGPHADLPLVEGAGAALGTLLATSEQSVVVDLGALRKAELVRFTTPFLEALYIGNRKPIWLVLEEADVFAPQQPMPDTARMLGEVDRIARRGRQFGFKLISLTQRPARLAKDVLTQLSTLVALGLTSPQDRKAIEAWVEGAGDPDKAKAVLDSLASLPVGEGWVWAPDHGILERVRFPKIRTPDTSATPKAGEPRKVAKVRKDVDVAALRAAMGSATSDEAAKTHRAASASALSAELADADRRGYERGLVDGRSLGTEAGWQACATLFRRELGAFAGAFPSTPSQDARGTLTGAPMSGRARAKDAAHTALPQAGLSQKAGAREKSSRPAKNDEDRRPPAKKHDDHPPIGEPTAAAGAGPALTGPQAKVVRALAWWRAMGTEAPTRNQVAVVAGWSPSSSNIRDRLSELRRLDLIDYRGGGRLALTATGVTAAGSERPLEASFEDSLRAILTEPQRRVLDVLLAASMPMLRDAIAEAVGWSPSSSNIRDRLSELSRLEIVAYPSPGVVALREWVRR